VRPALGAEPAMTGQVGRERVALARKPEADAFGADLRGPAPHLHLPAAVALEPTMAEHPEVEEQELDLARHALAARAQDDAGAPGVAVAVEVRAEERRHHRPRCVPAGGRQPLITRGVRV